jgi:hypothetical protein
MAKKSELKEIREEIKENKFLLISLFVFWIIIFSGLLWLFLEVYDGDVARRECHDEENIETVEISAHSFFLRFLDENQEHLCDKELYVERVFDFLDVWNPTNETKICLLKTVEEVCEIR